MKKIYTLLACMFATSAIFAQSQRLQLFEEFTGENCGPCASTNPGLNAILHDPANKGKIVAIKYQSPIPSAGPIYNSYKQASDNRLSYYTVNSAPSGRHNGQQFATGTNAPNHPGYFAQQNIDDANLADSPFNLEVSHQITPNYDSIYITIHATASAAVSGNLKLRVAVIENLITFTTAPGTNGEKQFEDVCRKMLPDPTGSAMPASMALNENFDVTLAWKLDKIYDLTQVAVIAFIQDDDDKKVHQAAKSEPVPLQLDGKLTGVSGVELYQCTDKINPVIELLNNGVENITSCEISYQVGSGASQTYTWTGDISTGQTANVNIPEITVTNGAHALTFTINKVNGNADAISGNTIAKTANILTASTAAPFSEGFQTATTASFPVNNEFINNPTGTDTWVLATGYGGYATGSTQKAIKMIMYFGEEGEVDEFYLPKVDLSVLAEPTAFLHYDYAHTGVSSDPTTNLHVMISSDCGATWTTINSIDGAGLKTAPNTGNYFNPTRTQWKTAQVAIPNATTLTELMVKFVAETGQQGNNLWLDNIKLDAVDQTGVEENNAIESSLNIFPNPAKDNVTVRLVNGQAATEIRMIDNLGRIVNVNASSSNGGWNLNLENVSAGIYTVQVLNNTEVVAVSKLKVD